MQNPFDDPEFLAALAQRGVTHQPGMARELIDELTPLLAADGIDLNDPNLDVDIDELNAAFGRAAERRNLELATPVGERRLQVLAVLRSISLALSEGEVRIVDDYIHSIEPDGTEETPTVAQVIGVALGVLDTWFTDPALSRGLLASRPPRWHRKQGRQAAADMMGLARKHRAFDSQGSLIMNYGGFAVLEGAVLAVAAALHTLTHQRGESMAELSATLLIDREAPAPTPGASLAPSQGASQSAKRNAPHPPSHSSTPPGDGAAFGLQQPMLAAADYRLIAAFGTWLERQPVIAAPSVEIEISMFTSLLQHAVEEECDLSRPDDMLEFIFEVFGPQAYALLEADELDQFRAHINAAYTLTDFTHFQFETSAHRSAWEEVEDALDELLTIMTNGDEPGGSRLPIEELTAAIAEGLAIDADTRLAALQALPIIRAVPQLLEWIGTRRRVTQTRAIRRDEIAEVAQFIGLNLVGSARSRWSVLAEIESETATDADIYANAPQYVTSMWDSPPLSAWWVALETEGVIRTNTASVAPDHAADTWRHPAHPSLAAVESLICTTLTQYFGDLASDAASDRISWFEGEALVLTLQRLTQAVSQAALSIPPVDAEAPFTLQIMWARSSRMLEDLETFGLLTLTEADEPFVAPELRHVLAQTLLSFAQGGSAEDH